MPESLPRSEASRCVYCGTPTGDGTDEHEACWQRSACEALEEECPMCGWTAGTNPASCFECADYARR
jgi:hypothetical protein